MNTKTVLWSVLGVTTGVVVWLIGCATPAARRQEAATANAERTSRLEHDLEFLSTLRSDVAGAVPGSGDASGQFGAVASGSEFNKVQPRDINGDGVIDARDLRFAHTQGKVHYVHGRGVAQEALRLEQDIRYKEAIKVLLGRDTKAGIPPTVDQVIDRVAAGEELWIITRDTTTAEPGADDPPSGALLARLPDETEDVAVPLKHTDVNAAIAGYIATVNVTQQFHNPYDEKIEAVYVFPLPHNAAVNEFVMTVGDRRIRGIIREREEAEAIYIAARDRGHVAALMTQQRPNIFTQKVANIEPGKDIDIDITYFNTLRYVDGAYEFAFPMVVGPRFNPPACPDPIAAVPRGAAAGRPQETAIEYLAPHERSGHDIAITVAIDAGVDIEEITCATHAIETAQDDPAQATVTLSELDVIPNKDFVLRYRVAGERVKSSLMVHRDERGGYFTMMLYPPEDLCYLRRQPMEMIFVLDCSGSMRGTPLALARSAVERALKRLGPDDTFQIIRFSSSASQMGSAPIAATPHNIHKGLKYLAKLDSSGGTMMIEGIKAALDFEHDPERFRIVSFMTDGYIGNEKEILGAVIERVGDARLFSFGVGKSVNRYLLDSMARVGRGAVAYVGMDEDAAAAVDGFYDCVTHPAMTDIHIDWGTLAVEDVFPRRVPDLFAGRPVILTGRFTGAGAASVRVEGRAGSETVVDVIDADLDAVDARHPGIAAVWARMQIRELADRVGYEIEEEHVGEITTLALSYNLMSQYTSFVAVDSLSETAGDHGVSVYVPVPVPEGVRYETTVGSHGE